VIPEPSPNAIRNWATQTDIDERPTLPQTSGPQGELIAGLSSSGLAGPETTHGEATTRSPLRNHALHAARLSLLSGTDGDPTFHRLGHLRRLTPGEMLG